jgi:hypothetical protein
VFVGWNLDGGEPKSYLIVQVKRPFGDRLYPSGLVPFVKLTGIDFKQYKEALD